MIGRKLRLSPLTTMVVLLLVGGALALPVINVVVQQMGAGSNQITSPVNNAKVNFVVDSNKQVTAVKVSFDQDLASGSYIRVDLLDSNNNIVGTAEASLNTNLTANTQYTINLNSPVDVENVDSVAVFVKGPEQ